MARADFAQACGSPNHFPFSARSLVWKWRLKQPNATFFSDCYKGVIGVSCCERHNHQHFPVKHPPIPILLIWLCLPEHWCPPLPALKLSHRCLFPLLQLSFCYHFHCRSHSTCWSTSWKIFCSSLYFRSLSPILTAETGLKAGWTPPVRNPTQSKLFNQSHFSFLL